MSPEATVPKLGAEVELIVYVSSELKTPPVSIGGDHAKYAMLPVLCKRTGAERGSDGGTGGSVSSMDEKGDSGPNPPTRFAAFAAKEYLVRLTDL